MKEKIEKPKISEAEWKILNELWVNPPKSSYQIVSSVADANDWSPNTVKTLISRLVKKGVVGFEKRRNEHLYFPLMDREELVANESEGFLKKLFGGATAPMMAHFAKQKKLRPEEAAELKAIIDQMTDGEV